MAMIVACAALPACGATLLSVSDGGRESASETWECRLGSGANAKPEACQRKETSEQLRPSGFYRRAYVLTQQSQEAVTSHATRVNFRSAYADAPDGICEHGVHRTDLLLKRSGSARVLFECALPVETTPIGPPP